MGKQIAYLTLVLVTLFSSACSNSANSESELDSENVYSENDNSETKNLGFQNNRLIEPESDLDFFEKSSEQQLIIDTAQWSFAKVCMEKLGYEFTKSRPTIEPKLGETSDIKWGGYDADAAAEYGYIWPDAPDVPVNENEEGYFYGEKDGKAIYHQGELPQEMKDLSSCAGIFTGHLEDRLGNVDESDTYQYQVLKNDAEAAAASDPEVIQSIDAWTNCMKLSGYTYSEPGDPHDEYLYVERSKPDQAEIDLAVADVACKNQIQFMQTYWRVLHAKQSDLIDKYRPMLERQKKRNEQEVSIAQEIAANAEE